MAMLNTVAKAITKPMPRMISPKSHSMLDYVTAGVFLAGAGFFWRQQKGGDCIAYFGNGGGGGERGSAQPGHFCGSSHAELPPDHGGTG